MDTRINNPGNDRTWRLDAAPAIDLGSVNLFVSLLQLLGMRRD